MDDPAVERDDDVAAADADAVGRAVDLHILHDGADRVGETRKLALQGFGRARGQAEVAVFDRLSSLEPLDEPPLGRRHGDRKTDAVVGRGPGVHRGDDADEFPVDVEKRAAGVSRIDDGRGLEHVVVKAIIHVAEAGQPAAEV